MNETIKSLEASVRVSCHGAFLAHHISHVVRLSSIIFHFHNESHIFHHHQRERMRNFFLSDENRFTSRLRGFSFVFNFHCYSTLGRTKIFFLLSTPAQIFEFRLRFHRQTETFRN